MTDSSETRSVDDEWSLVLDLSEPGGRGLCLHVAKHVVHVDFLELIGMESVKGELLLFDVLVSWNVSQVVLNGFLRFKPWVASTITREVGCFIHIKPESVELNLGVKV